MRLTFTPPYVGGTLCHRASHSPHAHHRTTRLPRRQAERVALSRSVVIFADYLSDLAVLDSLSDITASSHPLTTAAIALLGAAAGVLAADLITGLAALTVANLPDGAFDVFGAPHAPRIVLRTSDGVAPQPLARRMREGKSGVDVKVGVEVETEVMSVVEVVTPQRDIFARLQNSCFVAAPPLTVFTGWAEYASGDGAVFIEAFLVALLSLSALAPILRAGGKDCELIAKMRRWGLLKRQDVGWCQVCGVWDGVLDWGFRRRPKTSRRPP